MDFDFTTETITPDNTSILTIGGNGALELPSGTTAQQPVSGVVAGAIRWNTTTPQPEFYNGTAWNTFAGSVTSVNLTAGTGISVSGGPITSSGSITVNNTGVTSAIGTANQVNVSAATGAVTFSLPQSIGTSSSPTFASVTITNTPSAGTDAATKNYVDSAIAGLSWKQAVRAATTTNGTLATAFANGQAIDGVTLATGDRILIKNQTNQTENGIYIVQASGAPVRATDADTGAELVGASVYVDQGTVNADTAWTQTTNAPITIGTSNIVWAQFSGSGSYTAGAGLTLTGNTFSLTSPVSPTLGGTGTTTAPTAGQVLYSSAGTNYAPTTLSTLAVTSFAGGTTGLTPAAATSGAITLGGTLAVANGGTGQTSYTDGQLLIGNSTGNTLTKATLTQGTGITITNGGGSITIANAGVTSFQTSLAGLTPSTSTTGAVTLAGTLGATSGGTGSASAPTAGQFLYSSGGTTYAPTTLSSQAVTTISFGTTGLTPSAATSGAVTVAGTLALANGGTNASLTAVNGGVVYSGASALAITAAGTSGQYLRSNGAAAPTWVTLTNGGLQLYAENASTPTAPSATGTNAVAIGNGSAASATNAIALGQGTSASIFGTKAIANGSFATAGDSQEVIAVLRNITSNATATELFLDGSGASQRLVLPNNSAWTYTIKISCRRTDATGSLGSWIFNGFIYKNGTAGSTTNAGIASKTTVARIGSIAGANDPTVTADTTNGSLKVTVTGNAAQTYRWVATAYLTQVTN